MSLLFVYCNWLVWIGFSELTILMISVQSGDDLNVIFVADRLANLSDKILSNSKLANGAVGGGVDDWVILIFFIVGSSRKFL